MKVSIIGFRDDFINSGMRYLEAGLVESGNEADLIILKNYGNLAQSPTTREYDILTSIVKDLNPDLIGISVLSTFVWLAKEATERLRSLGKPIVWGGIHTTLAPEYSIRRPDMILRGEADRTLPLLVEKLSTKGDLEEVPGLWWKDGNKIRKNPLGPPIVDLDSPS